MKPLDQRALRLWLRFRGQRLTIPRLMWASRRTYTLLFAYFAALASLIYRVYGTSGAGYVGVAYASLMLRDFGDFRRVVALWPLTQEVLDWSKIEKLGASDEMKIPPDLPRRAR